MQKDSVKATRGTCPSLINSAEGFRSLKTATFHHTLLRSCGKAFFRTGVQNRQDRVQNDICRKSA